MSEEEPHSLSDEQIKADYRTDPDFLPNVMKEIAALEERIGYAGDSSQVTVPVESLRTLRMGLLALIKTQTEFGFKPQTARESGFGWDSNHGDRGANCDYNPFIRINTGDLIPHTLLSE